MPPRSKPDELATFRLLVDEESRNSLAESVEAEDLGTLAGRTAVRGRLIGALLRGNLLTEHARVAEEVLKGAQNDALAERMKAGAADFAAQIALLASQIDAPSALSISSTHVQVGIAGIQPPPAVVPAAPDAPREIPETFRPDLIDREGLDSPLVIDIAAVRNPDDLKVLPVLPPREDI